MIIFISFFMILTFRFSLERMIEKEKRVRKTVRPYSFDYYSTENIEKISMDIWIQIISDLFFLFQVLHVLQKDKVFVEYTKIYDAAVKKTLDAKDFHASCDGKGPTLCIFRLGVGFVFP